MLQTKIKLHSQQDPCPHQGPVLFHFVTYTFTILQKLAPLKSNSLNVCFYFEAFSSFLLRNMLPITYFSLSRTCQASEVSGGAVSCELTKVVKGWDYVHMVGCVTLPVLMRLLAVR